MIRKTIVLPQETDVRRLAFSDLEGLHLRHSRSWQWGCPFVTPPWLSAWWQGFGQDYEPFLLQVEWQGTTIGIAPLMVEGGTARVVGSEDLCDHSDFPVEPGLEEIFFQTLISHLQGAGIEQLVVDSIRSDSVVMQALVSVARALGRRVSLSPNGVAVQMVLPSTWEDYLGMISAKQRHEVRRKLRRAAERGDIRCHLIEKRSELVDTMEIFLDFFRQSRSDKDVFMTAEREHFFRTLADGLAKAQMLNLFQIEIDNQPAAVVFCVALGSTTYLYNNGYDPRFGDISIGLVSKLMTIQESIKAGKKIYDFLNGPERYKYQLGGKELVLSTCTVEL